MTGDMEKPLARACSVLAQTMAQPGVLREVLGALVVEASTVLEVPGAAILLLDGAGRLRPAAATDTPGAGVVATELNVAEGPSLAAVREGMPVVVEDLGADARWPRYAAEARAAGFRSVLSVPLRTAGRTAGALTLVAPEPHAWQEHEVAAAVTLADLASGYVAHESELDKVRRTADQLQEALESRVDIEQAKGVLVGDLGCTMDQAFVILRNHARRNSVTLRSVAQAVVHLGLRPPAPRTRRRSSIPAGREPLEPRLKER